MRAVVELTGVTKRYPGTPPVEALRGVDLRVEEGELAAIVGVQGPAGRLDASARKAALGPLRTAAENLSSRLGWSDD